MDYDRGRAGFLRAALELYELWPWERGARGGAPGPHNIHRLLPDLGTGSGSPVEKQIVMLSSCFQSNIVQDGVVVATVLDSLPEGSGFEPPGTPDLEPTACSVIQIQIQIQNTLLIPGGK